MTVPIMINADFDGFRTSFILKTSDGTALGTINPPRENVGTWQNVTKVFTVPVILNLITLTYNFGNLKKATANSTLVMILRLRK